MKKIVKENIIPFIFAIITGLTMIKNPNIGTLIVLLLTIPLYFLIYRKLFTYLMKKEIEKKDSFNKKELILYGSIILGILLIYFLAYYPGYGTFDTAYQWDQALTNKYDDWHPVLSTLIFLKLPSLIYRSFVSCTIFQIIYISAILLYFSYFLRKNGISKAMTIVILLLFLLNPHIGKMSVTIWKDIPFSFSIFLSTLFLINIYQTNGEWIKNKGNLVLFIITIIGISFLRHNGIACSLVLLLVLAFIYKKERLRYLLIVVAILAIKFLVFPIMFNTFKIGSRGSGSSELLGVPLNQISYIYNNGGLSEGQN